MSELRDRMKAALRLRNLRPSIQECYLGCVRKYAKYHMRSPDKMGTKEVRDFFVHLRDERELKPITIKGYVAALKFFYTATLDQPEVVRPWLSPRVPKTLPVVLSGTEVEAVFHAVKSITYRAVLMTTYGAGLRISESCRLQVADIDSKRKLIHIRDGKAREASSVTPCSATVCSACCVSTTDRRALPATTSFQTTQIYTQVSPAHIRRVQNPLDMLGTARMAKMLG